MLNDLKLLIIAMMLTVAPMMAAQSSFDTFKIDGREFTLGLEDSFLLDFDDHKPASTSESLFETNFFEAGDCLYFNFRTMLSQQPRLFAFDRKTHNFVGLVTVVFENGVKPNNFATQFAGSDSDGTPYVASYCNQWGQANDLEFALYRIEVRDGIPYATARYEMVLPEGLATFDVAAVDGSLKSGKFSVYVVGREEKYITAPYDAGSSVVRPSTLARYDFDGNTKASPAAYATARLSVTTVYPHGNGTFTLFDLNCYGILADVFDYPRPTLCRFAGSGATTIERVADDFSGDLSDYSTGLAHGTVDGTTFVCYGNKLGRTGEGNEYTIAHAPSYPESYAAMNRAWTVADKSPSLRPADMVNHTRGIVVKPRQTADGLNFDIFSTPNVFATYAVRPVGSQTEVGDVTAPSSAPSSVRYYTLTGIAVDAPSRPGIYLAVEGSRVKKVIVR